MNKMRKIGVMLLIFSVFLIVTMGMSIAAPNSRVTNKVLLSIEGMT
jgi:hypothetical protein